MSKREKYIDIAALLIIGVLFCQTAYKYFTYNYIININTWLGLFCWVSAIGFKAFSPQRSRYFILVILLLGTLNIISFTAEAFYFGASKRLNEYHGVHYISLSINPRIGFLFIVYIIVNMSVISALWSTLTKPTNEEQIGELEKEESFYYSKFVNYDATDLEALIKNYKDYPEAGQAAIRKIVSERKEK